MSTILPFVFFSAILIALGVFWLVARSVMREIRASNQLVERRREEWRAGGCVGPEPGKYGAPSAATGEAGSEADLAGGGGFGV